MMVEHNEATLSDLEKEYCPPLDPALFTAIVFDYDVADAAQLQQLRETLDALKLSAWEQEDLPFDPSGTSGLTSSGGNESDPSLSQADTSPLRSTDVTSEFSALSISDRGRSTCPSRVLYIVGPDGTLSLSGATEEDKIYYLSEMFPTTERFTIEHTLKKSNGDVDRCMDVLLNFAFFDNAQPNAEDGKISLPKGVDGFENGDAGRKKRGKRKGKNRNGKDRGTGSSDSPDSDFALPDLGNTVNKWDVAQKDVDFICARTFPILKKEAVTSTYHSNGASLSATIQALAIAHNPTNKASINNDPVMASQIDELTQDFPEIAPELFAGLLTITRNSISAAHELAKAYQTVPAPRPAAELIKFTSTPPLDIEEEAPKRRTATSSASCDYEHVTAAAGYHYAAGAEALTKASAAYRRGKSDKLMGGAAAYYSAVGREHLERAKRNAAASADEFARRNATPNSIDLHGLSVQDAVRITSDRVSEWWESLGDSKYMRGSDGDAARGGYRIITGVGRHSHDGTSRLGPAVGKMLAREGWRVNVESGVLTVTGVVRRR